jgi:hypothetical protein
MMIQTGAADVVIAVAELVLNFSKYSCADARKLSDGPA